MDPLMPFRSKAQMRFMYAKHPKIAKKWTKEYGANAKGLPEKVKHKSPWMDMDKKEEK